MTVQEHYNACKLWMDNDQRLYERGVAIANVKRKSNDTRFLARLINDYADDIIATTNLKESAHPHMSVDGTKAEVKDLVVSRILEVFKEWDEEFSELDNAVKAVL